MKSIILIAIGVFELTMNCIAQKKDIVYSFDACIVDSLQVGIKKYESFFKKPVKELKLYALVVENSNEFGIYLQEYSHLTASGLLDLIKTTDRKLLINRTTAISVIVPADKMSLQVKKDNIAYLPLNGYYVKVVYENNKQKVVETAFLF